MWLLRTAHGQGHPQDAKKGASRTLCLAENLRGFLRLGDFVNEIRGFKLRMMITAIENYHTVMLDSATLTYFQRSCQGGEGERNSRLYFLHKFMSTRQLWS